MKDDLNKAHLLTKRSHEKEWLDLGPAYYYRQEYLHCHQMLFRINKLFGFFRDTVNILKKISPVSSLLDVGCGSGLFLLHLSKFFPDMRLEGIDISAEAIKLAQLELFAWQKIRTKPKVSFATQADALLQLPNNSVDVILATLVCHHLNDEELVDFLQASLQAASQLVVINDLHRHFLAECLYVLISPFLFRNRLITHDGVISIRRGFTRLEWKKILHAAGIYRYQISWRFPFRWRIVLWKK